jgi:hypothetical protein
MALAMALLVVEWAGPWIPWAVCTPIDDFPFPFGEANLPFLGGLSTLIPASFNNGPLIAAFADEDPEADWWWFAKAALGGRTRSGFIYFFMAIGKRLPPCAWVVVAGFWVREAGEGDAAGSIDRPDIILASWAMLAMESPPGDEVIDEGWVVEYGAKGKTVAHKQSQGGMW